MHLVLFAPKAWYAATGNRKDGTMIADELKTLIKELHRNGLDGGSGISRTGREQSSQHEAEKRGEVFNGSRFDMVFSGFVTLKAPTGVRHCTTGD